MTSLVYFISDGSRVKIGFTNNLENRFRNLQSGHGVELVLLGTIPGNILLERHLHDRFKHLRTQGEWFRADEQFLNEIKDIITHPPSPPVVSEAQADIDRRAAAARLRTALTAQFPQNTAKSIVQITGLPFKTIEKWLSCSAAPSLANILVLIDAFGADFLASLYEAPPDWLQDMARSERLLKLCAQIVAASTTPDRDHDARSDTRERQP